MKGSHWFIIFIVAFLVIMFAVEITCRRSLCGHLLSVIMMTSLSDVRCSMLVVCFFTQWIHIVEKDILSVGGGRHVV